MQPTPHSILVVSKDPALADVRKLILEAAGFVVTAALNLPEVEYACRNGRFDLVIIGYSMPPSEKRRASMKARELCAAPILELFNSKGPELIDDGKNTYTSHAHENLAESARKVISANRASGGA
jgi:CheY-like chemotaxis protein